MRNGQLSPVALVQAHLDRIAAFDGQLHAFITVTAESALAEARAAESEMREGRYRGPMHGIPIAHKDIVATAGVRTTAHSRRLADWIPQSDATVALRLRSAGAISLGKTSLHEFAFGSPGPDEAFPAARNPWNADHMPGSSSSGSGAAVAAGFCMGATGTDTGGSIRHPAAACGVVGMKPTFGVVSCRGVIPLAPLQDHVGPLTRTVGDNALMLQAMAGHDPLDPLSATTAVPDFSARMGLSVAGLRVGVPRRFIDSLPHDAETLLAFERAQRSLVSLGVQLVDIDIDAIDEANDAAALLLVEEAYAYHQDDVARRPEEFGETFKLRLLKGRDMNPAALENARKVKKRLLCSYSALFAPPSQRVHLIISPGRERAAETMEELLADPARRGLTNRMYNLSGMPALTLPMGFTEAGLPLGLQIAANHFSEPLIYQLASAFEAVAGCSARLPAPMATHSNPGASR